MKETVLDALLQLFAIIANVSEDGVSFQARAIVKTFLRQHLKTNLIKKYLMVFDGYLEIHHPHLFSGGSVLSKETLSDSEKLRQIAEEINIGGDHVKQETVCCRMESQIGEKGVSHLSVAHFQGGSGSVFCSC